MEITRDDVFKAALIKRIAEREFQERTGVHQSDLCFCVNKQALRRLQPHEQEEHEVLLFSLGWMGQRWLTGQSKDIPEIEKDGIIVTLDALVCPTCFGSPSQPADDAKRAYAAGIIDGEGCIIINKFPDPSQRVGYGFLLRIQVSMCDKETPEWMQKNFGGRLQQLKPQKHYRPQWLWTLVAGNAAEFLRQILPYLLVKTGQAGVGVLYQESKLKPGQHPKSSEQVASEEACRAELSRLKHEPTTPQAWRYCSICGQPYLPHELKVTYQSANKPPIENIHWIRQLMAQCYVTNTTTAILSRFEIMGDWKWVFGKKEEKQFSKHPTLSAYRLEFSQQEIDGNWAWLVKRRELFLNVLETGQLLPKLEALGEGMDFECNYCAYKEECEEAQ